MPEPSRNPKNAPAELIPPEHFFGRHIGRLFRCASLRAGTLRRSTRGINRAAHAFSRPLAGAAPEQQPKRPRLRRYGLMFQPSGPVPARSGGRTKKPEFQELRLFLVAERRGFEPLKPFGGLLAFQAGQFNHSCTSPTTVPSCDSGDKDRKIIANNLLFEDLFLKFPQKIVLLVSLFHPRRSPLRQYLNNIGQL